MGFNFLNNDSAKVFLAVITQSGLADPVINVLKNTTGSTFVLNRTGPGVYTLLCSDNVFTGDTVFSVLNAASQSSVSLPYCFFATDTLSLNSIDLQTFDISISPPITADDALLQTAVLIIL